MPALKTRGITGIEAQLSSNGIIKLLSNKTRKKFNANGFPNEQHFNAVTNIDRLYENTILLEERQDKNGSPDIVSIKGFLAPFYLLS